MSEWNVHLENTAKEIGETAKHYKRMHIKMAQIANFRYKILMTTGIVLGPLAGIISSFGMTLDEDTNHILSIIVTIIGFFSGITVAISKFSNYDAVSTANKTAAVKYTSLESNVRRQLSLNRTDRTSANYYMEWLANSYDELFMSAPLLPMSVYNCDDVSNTKDKEKPAPYEDTIAINMDYEMSKIKEISDHTEIQINSPSTSPVSQSPPLKGRKHIKRTETMASFPELGRYKDGMMNYELKRMFGF